MTYKIPALPWTDESPHRLYALFARHQLDELTGPLADEFANLLLSHVANYFSSNQLVRTLPQAHLDPMDVAQDAVIHLLRKTKAMKLRAPCYKVMLACLNTALFNFVATQVNTKTRKSGREMNATDYYRDRERQGEEPAEDGDESNTTEEGIFSLLDAARESVIDDIVIKPPHSRATLAKLFGAVVSYLAEHRSLPPHSALPMDLQKEVSLELHALVVSRVIRFVRDQAASG